MAIDNYLGLRGGPFQALFDVGGHTESPLSHSLRPTAPTPGGVAILACVVMAKRGNWVGRDHPTDCHDYCSGNYLLPAYEISCVPMSRPIGRGVLLSKKRAIHVPILQPAQTNFGLLLPSPV